MEQQASGFARAFEAHDSGIDIHSDHETIHITSNPEQSILLQVSNTFSCCHCQRSVKKLYSQAYCFPCSQALARCDLCILKPERCHYQNGTCREPSWGEQHCMIPHVVYLAWTSDFKVGITRKHRTHTRWREQGAIMAAALYETTNRHQAGLLENQMRNHYKDQTAWRKMLQCHSVDPEHFEAIFKEAAQHVLHYTGQPALPYQANHLHYPVHGQTNVATLASTSAAYAVHDAIIGIKGHYLLFKSGIISVRSLLGRHITYSV